MRSSYYVTNAIKEYLLSDGFVQTVTFGNLFDVDLNKQSIFPLAHIILGNASINAVTITLNMEVLFMDIIEETDDNTQDILNTQLVLANRLISELIRGNLFDELIQVESANAEPFIDRFENKLGGWAVAFEVTIPNEMSIC